VLPCARRRLKARGRDEARSESKRRSATRTARGREGADEAARNKNSAGLFEVRRGGGESNTKINVTISLANN
jgi:hypothetical protein